MQGGFSGSKEIWRGFEGILKENLDSLEIGKETVKHALHGFRGNVTELLRLYKDKSNEYIAKHMT